MKELFNDLEKFKPVTLLIRHAERFKITKYINPLEARLTEQGKADARAYGEQAAVLSPVSIYHSPVERCRQTAEGIAAGIRNAGGTADLKGVHEDLGGPYVFDDYASTPGLIEKHGHQGFFREWFEGRLSEDILMPIPQAAEIGMNCIREISDRHEHSVILVSHDWNIMILREFFLGQRHEDVGMPGFLEGLTYYKKNGGERMFSHDYDFNLQVEV